MNFYYNLIYNMGDVIENIKVKSITSKKPAELKIYFDSGSPFTFIF